MDVVFGFSTGLVRDLSPPYQRVFVAFVWPLSVDVHVQVLEDSVIPRESSVG